ncbi:DIE2/ALG10 family protein [Tanacetum coccineum]
MVAISKEEEVQKISTSIFVTNFPDHAKAKDLWNVCKQYGQVVDAFIPDRKVKAGRFQRPPAVNSGGYMHQNGNYVPKKTEANSNNGHRTDKRSYVNVVNGDTKSTEACEPALLLDESCFDDINLRYMGGMWIMIDFKTEDTKAKFQSCLGATSWFSLLIQASKEFVIDERITWVTLKESSKLWSEEDFDGSDIEKEGDNNVSMVPDSVKEDVNVQAEEKGNDFDVNNSLDPFELYSLLNKKRNVEEKMDKSNETVSIAFPLDLLLVTSAKKMSKLDRFLMSEGLLGVNPNFSALTLDRYLSDHRPIMLRDSSHDYGPIPFRMYLYWFEIGFLVGSTSFMESIGVTFLMAMILVVKGQYGLVGIKSERQRRKGGLVVSSLFALNSASGNGGPYVDCADIIKEMDQDLPTRWRGGGKGGRAILKEVFPRHLWLRIAARSVALKYRTTGGGDHLLDSLEGVMLSPSEDRWSLGFKWVGEGYFQLLRQARERGSEKIQIPTPQPVTTLPELVKTKLLLKTLTEYAKVMESDPAKSLQSLTHLRDSLALSSTAGYWICPSWILDIGL